MRNTAAMTSCAPPRTIAILPPRVWLRRYRQATNRSKPRAMLLGAHQREEDHVADRRRARQQHRETIDADPLPSRRWHAVLERAAVILVVVHRLLGAGGLGGELRLEAGALVVGIVQLGEPVRDLAPRDVQLEAIDERGIRVLLAGERR